MQPSGRTGGMAPKPVARGQQTPGSTWRHGVNNTASELLGAVDGIGEGHKGKHRADAAQKKLIKKPKKVPLDSYALGLRKANKSREADLGPSERFHAICYEDGDEAKLGKRLGCLRCEVLQAGGWSSQGIGDVLSAEDVYVLLTVDGLVARTNTRNDARAPTWHAKERRAFSLEVRDARATLFVAVADEDDAPLERDGYIGRCALPIRALRPSTTYDAWLPLRLEGTRDEENAIDARHLVKGRRLKDAAALDPTQRQSRGSVRLRLRMDWDDGGVQAARSVLLGGPVLQKHVVLPETNSGRKQRDVARFALWGEAGDHGDPCVEPVATHRVMDHLSDLLDAWGSLKGALPDYIGRLSKYERPLRSLVAFAAWWASCANPQRVYAWLWVHAALAFRDSLYGQGDSQLQQAQFTFCDWVQLSVFGKPLAPLKPTSKEDAFLAEKRAIRRAAKVSEAMKMDAWRRQHLKPPPKEPEPTSEVYRTWSLNPLAPLLRPIQKALLKNVRLIRPLQNALRGSDDPVFVSSCAGACFLIAGVCFVWSEAGYPRVEHLLAKLKYASVRAAGVALFGPQNFLLVRSKARKKRAAQAREALILIDGRNRFAYLIQKCWRKHHTRITDLKKAKEAKEAALAKALRLKNRRDKATARMHAKGLQTAEEIIMEKTKADIAQHDAHALLKLDATLAKKLTPRKPHKRATDLGLAEYVGEAPRLLEKTPTGFKMSKPNATPTDQDPQGIKKVTHVRETAFAEIVSVAPNDPARPKAVTFSHREKGSKVKRHTLTFENEVESEDFADGLRAVVRLHNRGELGGHTADPLDAQEETLALLEDETDFEHTVVTVPGPCVGGLLPAALVERGAWLCPARSRVVNDQGLSEAPMSPRLTEDDDDF